MVRNWFIFLRAHLRVPGGNGWNLWSLRLVGTQAPVIPLRVVHFQDQSKAVPVPGTRCRCPTFPVAGGFSGDSDGCAGLLSSQPTSQSPATDARACRRVARWATLEFDHHRYRREPGVAASPSPPSPAKRPIFLGEQLLLPFRQRHICPATIKGHTLGRP